MAETTSRARLCRNTSTFTSTLLARAVPRGRPLFDADPRAQLGTLADLAHSARGGDVEHVHGQ